jgi:hypothetical protein
MSVSLAARAVVVPRLQLDETAAMANNTEKDGEHAHLLSMTTCSVIEPSWVGSVRCC